jgi:SOS-response transcriptional repressor LexA
MIAFDEVVERLKDILSDEVGEKKVYDKDVADSLEISAAAFATMKRRSRIPYEEIVAFCSRRKISINWLLFNQNPSSLVETTNRYQYIKYFPDVNVSAGGGAYDSDEDYEMLALEGTFFEKIAAFSNASRIEAVNVVGDSMEPTIADDSIVFIDRDRCDIAKGGIFALVTPSGLFIKRIQIRVDGAVDIISDNRDYPVQTVAREEVTIIGKVIGMFGEVS